MGQSFDFTGKVALVTGVARANQIGHAIAEAFGLAGARIVVADRNAVAVAERVREFAARGIGARAAAGDLTEPDVAALAVETALKQFGRLDVLVNVAGGLTTYGPIGKTDLAAFEREVNINLKTAFLMCQASIEALARSEGCIVNFASMAALRPVAPMAAYAAAKSAVAGLTTSLALELRDRKIRVNAIAPGMVRTPDNVASVGGGTARWVEMSQITDGVLFLASAAAGAITGHILPVTNGDL
ncbi:MAG: SDR family NAD(P)-dependent oxidoreductase [Gemmatimonadales bacterium]|jgi:NAD(P)-dependent dehydrogenase (short-subunit alcohol dehydrogenase family)